MINDDEAGTDEDYETTTAFATLTGSNSLGNSLLLVNLLRQSLAKQPATASTETEFGFDPLPEREERFWDSANDISLSSLGGLENDRFRTKANSNANTDGNNNNNATAALKFTQAETHGHPQRQQNISNDYTTSTPSRAATSATSCVTPKNDPDKPLVILRRSQLKLPQFSRASTPGRSLSLPEKIWNELLGRTDVQTDAEKPVKKVNFNNRPTVYAAMADEDGLDSVPEPQPQQKSKSSSRWKFFTKSFRKRKSFKIKKSPVAQTSGPVASPTAVLQAELPTETPRTKPTTTTPPNFFRSFRLKRNKVKAMRPEEGGTPAPGTKNPGFLSSPFNRRRGGAGRLNPHLFSSLYHRGRNKFSAAELDDVTLDLSSGELVKTGDGTLIGRNDIVSVTAENSSEEHSSASVSITEHLQNPDSYSAPEAKQVGDADEELSPRSSTSTNTGDSSSSFASSSHNNNVSSSKEKSSNNRRSSRSGSQTTEDARTGTSPSKSLFGKVKEMGKNSKRKFSLSRNRKDSQGSVIEETDSTGNASKNDEAAWALGNGNSVPLTSAIDIIGTSAQCGSSEEELSSIPNSAGRGSISLSETEEYNGPFVGRAVANVDFISSPYDRHALSYKKGDLVEIIQKRPTGSWIGKVNNKVGSFKFINVDLVPDDDDFDETDVHDNYDEVHEDEHGHSHSPAGSDYRASTHYTNGSSNARRRTKRLTPLTAWELEQRQTVANVINGIRKENAALSLRQQQKHEHSKSLDSESPFHVQASQSSGRKTSSSGNSAGRRKGSSSSTTKKGRPKSVGDLLRRINLEEHISVFILHGFDSLDIFQELEEEDLDRLEILNPAARRKILTAVELLREYAAGDEIPPIIIPTYSSASQMDLMEDVQDHLNHILDPPPSFSRGSSSAQAKVVRDSGVFLKCEETEDPEVEEIILSPINLPMTSMTLNSSDAQILASAGRGVKGSSELQDTPKGIASLEEHYGEVRQRFLHAKSLFETAENGAKSNGNQHGESNKNQFLYCEKSSDSGISLGANSPPPNTRYE